MPPLRNPTSIGWLAALVALLVGGCSPSPVPSAAPDATYSVRGEIARLPTESSPELWIHHEAIAGFRDERGETVGMDSMIMPFPLTPGVAIDGLAPGDRIAFDFEVRWRGAGRPLAITRLELLPEGALLDFDEPAAGGAQPASAAEDGSSPQ